MPKEKAKQSSEIHNWYKDRYQRVVVQRKILTLITFLALGSTFVAVILLLKLMPLKTIEPYVIQVDQKSGITQTVDPTAFKELTSSEVVNNYFIVAYIRAREGYGSSDLMRSYDLVRIMSDPGKVYRGFLGEADANNPQSNVARLGSVGVRQVRFKSITYLSPQVVQARVLIEEKGDGVSLSHQYHKIILVGFEYTKMNLTTDERYVNPLGFRVIEYRVDEDLLQQ